MQQTLPKSIILRGYQSFTRIISTGTRIQGVLVAGYVLIESEAKKPDMIVGFTVSKKRVALAVLRNRIKRLMRESVRKSIHEIREIAIRKRLRIEVVLSYTGGAQTEIRRLTLRDIEQDWSALHRRILEKI